MTTTTMTTMDDHQMPSAASSASAAPSPPTPAPQAPPSPNNTPAKGSPVASKPRLEHSPRQHHTSSVPDASTLSINSRYSPEESAAHGLQDLGTTSGQPKLKPRASPTFNSTHANGFSRGHPPPLPSIKTAVNDGGRYASPPLTARGSRASGMFVHAPYPSGVPGPGVEGTYAQSSALAQRNASSPNGHPVSALRAHINPSPRTPRFGPYPSPNPDTPYRSMFQSQHHKAPLLLHPNMLSSQQPSHSTENAHNVNGFRIWRNAIPLETAQRAADMMDQGLPVHSKHDTHVTYETSVATYEVRDEFTKVSSHLPLFALLSIRP